MAWNGQKGVPISQSAQYGNKCFLELGCVQGGQPGAPQRLHFGGSACCHTASGDWRSALPETFRGLSLMRRRSPNPNLKGIKWEREGKKRGRKGKRKERWVRRKQAQILERGGESNLIPLSGCKNVLAPEYKDKIVIHFREAKASSIHMESED